MDVEGIMLSEISQRKTIYDFTDMWDIRKQNKPTKQKQTHRCKK